MCHRSTQHPPDQAAPDAGSRCRHTILPKESARRARVDAIRDGAITRAALGQAAQHRRDGELHIVSLYDRAIGELRTWRGVDLDEVLTTARKEVWGR